MRLETKQPTGYRETTLYITLQEVERRLREAATAPGGRCAELAGHLIAAGGKRLRPLLVLLAGGFEESRREPVLAVAVAAELIHTASLIHDDILDEAHLRRGVVTINSRWGNHTAVLAGDFLFAAAFRLLAQSGADGERAAAVLGLMTRAVQEMCQGELEETDSLFRTNLTEEEYLSHIEKKTASLLAACCGAGALAGGADPQTAAALQDFGRNLGLAYQIVDDLLDFSSDEQTLGKPAGSDLDRGVLTLPVIYLLRQGLKEDIPGIKAAASQDAPLTYAYERARHFAGRARECLRQINHLPTREQLLELLELAVSRRN